MTLSGNTLIVESVGDSIDPALDPVISRALIKRGQSMYLALGEKEVEYDPTFRLYLQSRLSNPHYK